MSQLNFTTVVLMMRIELTLSPLPRECFTTKLHQHITGLPRAIRTPDPGGRSSMLYPAELWAGCLVQVGGVEPPCCEAADFKSAEYTNFSTPALKDIWWAQLDLNQ